MESNIEEVTQAELLDLFLEQHSRDLNVAIPCKVESYSASAQTVDVVPALNRSVPDGAGNYITEKLPKLSAIPVVFPRCGQFGITFPIAVGDYGLVVVCDRNIAAWRSTGNQGDPGDLGLHTLDGAVFIPGLFPDSKPANSADGTNMVMGSDTDGNSRIEFKPSGGGNLGAGATDNIVTKADIDAIKSAISGAAVVANDGGAALKNNIIGAWPASVGSSKWKAVR